jgi:predicted amidophosphoribosyltransferase
MALITELLDVALGRRCLECARPGQPWCDCCLRARLDVHRVRTSGGSIVLAATRYEGSVRDAVLAHKEHGQLALSTPLGRLLAAALSSGTPKPASLVPVPSTRAAVRARGHDHARRLARASGAVLDVPVVPALSWSRSVADQSGLSVAGRRSNVTSGMTARLSGRLRAPVWVVDDVTTSGATLDEAVRALSSAGLAPGGLAVVAAVEVRTALASLRGLR